MTEPIWLPLSVVLSIHDRLLDRHGGSQGIRDHGLLESALARPRNLVAYQDSDMFTLAAAYGHGIIQNHPFIDGNKRTGYMASYTFLGVNGWRLIAPETDATHAVLSLAAGEVDDRVFAHWIRENSVEK